MLLLKTPSLPRVIRDGVFDAWAWCTSEVIEWRRPSPRDRSSMVTLPSGTAIEGHNPPNLVFVMRDDSKVVIPNELPTELAHLHAFGYEEITSTTRALAPYAIDDATDLLYEHRVRPHDIFWLAASTLDALVWGLHDWAHFHNHGPFDEPAMTELQCDLIAIEWLRLNLDPLALDDPAAVVQRVAHDLARLSRRRFEEEGIAAPVNDLEALFSDRYPQTRL